MKVLIKKEVICSFSNDVCSSFCIRNKAAVSVKLSDRVHLLINVSSRSRWSPFSHFCPLISFEKFQSNNVSVKKAGIFHSQKPKKKILKKSSKYDLFVKIPFHLLLSYPNLYLRYSIENTAKGRMVCMEHYVTQ